MLGVLAMILADAMVEGGVAVSCLALAGGVLLRQSRRDKKHDSDVAKIIESKEQYARDLAASNMRIASELAAASVKTACDLAESNVQAARDFAEKSERLVINNTRAMIELTAALQVRPCLIGDPRTKLEKDRV